MAMPSITDAELVGLNAAGERVLSTASLTQRFYDRALWLARVKPAIHWSWSDGEDCPVVADTLGTGLTVTESSIRTEWTIGKALVPGVGNETGIVRLYVRQSTYTSGTLRAGLRVRSVVLDGTQSAPGPWVDLGMFSLSSSVGWRSSTLTVPAAIADGPFEAWVYLTTTGTKGTSTSVAARVSAWSLCSEGTAWPRTLPEALGAHFRRQTGTPDDVFTLRLLRDYQADSAAVPTILANHSFDLATGVGVNRICRYVIPAPIHSGTLTIHVRCRTTGGVAATLYAACDTSDTTGTGVPASDGSTAFTSATMAWRTVTVTPTAGSTNYLWVWVDPDAADVAEIEAVYATQADPDDDAITTGAPGWRILPLGRRDAVPGAPIVNSYSGGLGGETPSVAESIQNLWTDRFATMNNAKWWPQTRGSVTLPGDWVVSGTTYTNAFDSSSPAFGVQTQIQPRWGASEIVSAARITTDGIPMEADERLAWRFAVDSSSLAGPEFAGQPGGVPSDRYVQFGGGSVDALAASTAEVYAGYTTLAGVPAAGTVAARIEGVAVWERPPVWPANAVHIREYSAVGAAIPDNDIVTGVSDSITFATRNFVVGMPRAHVVIDHADASQLKITLSDGTTTRRLADFGDLAGSGTQAFSFSDSYEDDTAPDETLAAFAGVSSADTWTLAVYDNTAGDTGSLIAWALELW